MRDYEPFASRRSIGESICLRLTSRARLDDYVLERSPELNNRAVKSQRLHQTVTHRLLELVETDRLNLAVRAFSVQLEAARLWEQQLDLAVIVLHVDITGRFPSSNQRHIAIAGLGSNAFVEVLNYNLAVRCLNRHGAPNLVGVHRALFSLNFQVAGY